MKKEGSKILIFLLKFIFIVLASLCFFVLKPIRLKINLVLVSETAARKKWRYLKIEDIAGYLLLLLSYKDFTI